MRKIISTDTNGQVLSFFIGAMIAVIMALQVALPVINVALTGESWQQQTGESFNVSGNADTYMQLTNYPIRVSSETVYNASFTATRAVDYNMNYTDGTIQPLSTGHFTFNESLGSTVYSIDYNHSSTTNLQNMSAPAKTLVNQIPLFLVLLLLMVFIRPFV